MKKITYMYYNLLLEIQNDNSDPEDIEILIEDSLNSLSEETGLEIKILDFSETADEDIIR